VDTIDASGVDEALAVLAVSEKEGDEKRPEKRVKAAWLAFEERELPGIKAEKPGLRIRQYQDMLWKQWQKHPDNPLVQAAAAAAAARQQSGGA
jgi:hypothetical protein